MKVLLLSLGTRGDVEPYLAAGLQLTDRGHEVEYCLPEQFVDKVPQGIVVHPMSPEFLEMVEGPLGRALMSGRMPTLAKVKAASRLAKQGLRVNKILETQQFKALETCNPDLIVCHPKCSVPLTWSLRNRKRLVFLSPIPFYVHEDARLPHTGINRDLGPRLNRLSYRLLNFALGTAMSMSQSKVPRGDRIGLRTVLKALSNVDFAFAVSPALYPRDDSWPSNVQVLGSSARRDDPRPLDERLSDFLAEHPRPLFVTFGSMVSADPERASRALCSAIEQAGVPAVVNLASGGLVRIAEYEVNPLFHFVTEVDYNSLLPKVSAVIHHGGAGTSHLGLSHGCPTLIVPHVFDQFVWGNFMESKGVGPKAVPVNKLDREQLVPLIRDLVTNKSYRDQANRIAKLMAEDPSDALAEFLTKGA